jgi:hypothetical protein
MNRLFLTAISGECSLLVLHGIKPRYNPFTLLREQALRDGVELNRSQLKNLLWLRQIHQDNNLKEHSLLAKAIDKLEAKKVKEGV